MKNPILELERRLAGRNMSEVARRAGMARDNVARIASGKAGDVYVSTIVRLIGVLDAMDGEEMDDASTP